MNTVDNDDREPKLLDGFAVGAGAAVGAHSDEKTSSRTFKHRVTSWRSGPRFWPSLWAVGIGLIALVTLGLYLSWEMNKVDVPDLTGLTVDEAEEKISALGLSFDVEQDLSEEMTNFHEVVSQKPSEGTRASPNSSVAVVTQPRSLDVPSVVGQTLSSAEAEFQLSGFEFDVTNYELPPDIKPDTEGLATLIDAKFGLQLDGSAIRGQVSAAAVEEWLVVGQETAAGSQAKAGTSISLSVQIPVAITPNFVGMTGAEAKALAQGAVLTARTDSFMAPAALSAQASTIQGKALPPESGTWLVAAQDNPAGSVLAKRSQVLLTLEWPAIAVPSVIGLTNAEAEAAIEKAGLVSKLEIANPTDWRAYKQDPAAGSTIFWGSTVTYGVRRPPSGSIEFRVTGNGSSATVTWISPSSFSIQQATDAALPWSQTYETFSTLGAYERGNFSAQMHDGDTITCQMIVDGKVVMDRTSTGAYAIVSCG